jgi:hypothetical protein
MVLLLLVALLLRHIDPIIHTFNILSAACGQAFCEIRNALKEHEIAEKFTLQPEIEKKACGHSLEKRSIPQCPRG